MVYADVYDRAQFEDYRATGAYIDYRTLARLLKKIKLAEDPTTPSQLLDELSTAHNRVVEWVAARIRELTEVAERARQSCVQGNIDADQASQTADALSLEALRLQEARNLNADAILRIVERMRHYSVLPLSKPWEALEDGRELYRPSLDAVWYCVSSIYSYARGDGTKASDVAGAVGSQDFVRRSVKYWVHKQDLPFVISRVVRHLPLSMAKDTYADATTAKPFALGAAVSSVYFDNTNFYMYHQRMRRLEGSSLFRIRWYGNEGALQDDTGVFVELKVHHEAWSGEASTKRRFGLKACEVDAFLNGRMSLNETRDSMVRRGASERDVAKFERLAVQILSSVKVRDLKPVLRTEYDRCAFQRGSDQSVRVSIDTNLRMSAEDFGANKHWCRPKSADLHAVDFPFAVVEVKLQCAENERIPMWVEELMKCRFMEGVPKFSKYAHGIAALYGAKTKVSLMPYWLHQLDADIRAATKPEPEDFDAVRGLTSGAFESVCDSAIFGEQAPQARRADASREDTSWRVHDEVRRLLALPADAGEARRRAAQNLHVRHIEYRARDIWVEEEAEADCLGYAVEGGSRREFGQIPGQTAKRVRVPQRFDPKTFFTAERYFLRWVESSVLVGLAALFLLRFGESGQLPLDGPWWATRVHTHVALALMLAAVLSLQYALIQLNTRDRRIYARHKIRFDDSKGPAVLTALLIGALGIVGAQHVAARFAQLVVA